MKKIVIRCIISVQTNFKEIVMKKVKKIESELCCRANASLNEEIQEDLDKPDKSLGELLDEKEQDRNEERVYKRRDCCE